MTKLKNNQESEVLVSGTIKLWLDEDGIVHGELLPSSGETLLTAQENVAALRKLLSSLEPRPFLLDLRAVSSISREAREYYSGPEASGLITRNAVLVSSPVSRLVGSFFLRINKLPQPLRLFSTESEALAWLRKDL